MKKNKFTSLVAIITSIAFVGSMVALPAYAAESTDTNITNEKTITKSSTPSRNSAITIDKYSNEEKTSGFVGDPNNLLPVNVYTGQDNQIRSRANISTFASGSSQINASDLRDWVVFDNYDTNSGSDKPANWDTTTNSDGLHPWFYFYEDMPDYTGVHQGEYYDISDINGVGTTPGKIEYIEKVLKAKIYGGGPAVARVSNHIFTMGSADNAEMYFAGYGSSPYLDFALTKTPNSDTSLKSIAFDIDAAALFPHTTNSFGFLINSGISGDILKGQAINFVLSYGSIQPQIKDLSSGISASALHYGGSLTGISSGPAIALPDSGRIHLDIQADNDKQLLTIEITPYDATNALDVDNKQTLTTSLAQTGYQAFGPYVQYNGHGCSELSWMKFGNIQLSSNLDVHFWTNPNNGANNDNGEKFIIVNDIEKGNSINTTVGATMPTAPKQDKKSFKGWNMQPDGNGAWFTADTPINNTTNVYAIWGDSGVEVTYTPNNQWTKDSVDVNIVVSAASKPEKVIVKFAGEPDQEVTVAQNPNNSSEFIGKIIVDKNKAGGEIFVTVSDGQGGTNELVQPIDVTWIDKEAPIIGTLPTGDSNDFLTVSDLNTISFTDPTSPGGSLSGSSPSGAIEYSSGVNEDSRTVYFFQNGKIVKEIKWSNLSSDMPAMKAGIYGYAVSVEDNVGNYNDSNGEVGQPSKGPKPDKPTIDKVIINAATPTITTTLTMPNGSPYQEGTWVNQNVKVEYTVNGQGTDLKTVTVDGAEKLTSSAPDFKNSFIQSITGEKTYEFETMNVAGLSATASAAVWVDKIAPVVEVPKSNTDFDETAFIVSDADSGIDDSKTTVKAVPYVNGKLDASKAEIIGASVSGWSMGLNEGVIYQLTLTGVDNAGNSTSKTVDKIQYVEDPDAVKNNKDVDLWGVTLDGGKYKISVDSKTYPIETLSISIDNGAKKVIPTLVGANYAEFIQSMTVKQTATIEVKLVGGVKLTGTFSPLNLTGAKFKDCNYISENHPKPAVEKNLVPESALIKSATASGIISGSDFKNAVAEGFTLDGKPVSKPTVQYMGRPNSTPTAAYKLYPNPTLLFTAARNREYEVILVVTVPGEGTFYVNGSATSSKIAPSIGESGYIIQG